MNGTKPAFRAASSSGIDRQFIRSNWSRSFKQSHDAGMIYTDDWADIMHKQIDRVLDGRSSSRALICYEKTDPDFFYGWIAGDTSEHIPIVYFVYVKEPFRRSGFGRALLEAFGVDVKRPFIYTCRTSIVRDVRGRIPFARYNPLEVRYPKEARRSTWQPNKP